MNDYNRPPVKMYKGKYVNLIRQGRWEYATRNNICGIVGIVAVTDNDELVMVEQYRVPVGKVMIEMPAGLAGDAGESDESLVVAAQRELLEETGYEASEWEEIFRAAPSAGICDEEMTFFLAKGLTKTGEGGGDEVEDIKVHVVPLEGIHQWLEGQIALGKGIDLKIYAGLRFT